MSTLYTLLAEVEHELAPIVMPPLAFAGIAAAVFITLGLVTFSHRDVANRHSDKVSADSDDHGGHH
ncbi:MAG: hypothetical protein ABW040_04725 [Microbacteriaceae bacterium]